MKTYNIKTIADLENIITSKNASAFLQDFTTWLAMCITAKEMKPQVLKPDFTHFEWIDDGKHNINVTIKHKV